MAAFSGSSAFTDGEKTLLGDIAAHEKAHREFFKAAIPSASRIKDNLTTKYGTLNFADRTSVLATAMAFEDLGVSAYNGAGPKIVSADYLTLAGKIVSVEARHAAFIRELIHDANSSAKRFVDSDIATVDFSKAPSTFQSPIDQQDNATYITSLQFSATANNAFEIPKTPAQVLPIASQYITEILVNKITI